MASTVPLYNARDLHPAYHLRYAWTGWLADPRASIGNLGNALEQARPGWEDDGLRVLEPNRRQEGLLARVGRGDA